MIAWNRLHQLVSYDAATGVFIRKGRVIGTLLSNGYLQARIEGTKYLLHRLAWFYVHGEWPVEVDHRDGVRNNNAIENLRSCTHAGNQQNMAATGNCNNKSGHAGVCWHIRQKKWVATISHNNRTKTVGTFDTIDEAVAARVVAKATLHTFNPESRS